MTTGLGRFRGWGLVLALALSGAPAADGGDAARTRLPTKAGSWYPDGRVRLLSAVHYLMRTVAGAPRLGGRPVALVVPHANWNFSGLAAATAYRQLRPGDFDRVVVVAPAHRGDFLGYALDDAAAYRTPLGDIPLCEGATTALASAVSRVVPGVAETEYALEVELPFLQVTLGEFCLVPVLAGSTDAGIQSTFAERLARLDDGRTLFVFSSDFAHYGPRYGFEPFGPLSAPTRERIRALDDRAVALLEQMDALGFRDYLRETGSTICGRHGLATMLELLPRIAPRARTTLLAHYASADLLGTRDPNTVTYVTLGYVRPATGTANGVAPTGGAPLREIPPVQLVAEDAPAVDEETGRGLVRLARLTLETELQGKRGELGPALAGWPEGADEERHQGVFVSLYRTRPVEIHSEGRLRACRGQALPVFPLYFGVVQAALDAAGDERFGAVRASELDELEVEVTVLSRHRAVASPADIRLGTHGIVLEKDGKAALFLPQIPSENGWTIGQTLSALAEKAGLPPDAWKDDARLYVFTGQAFAEERWAAES